MFTRPDDLHDDAILAAVQEVWGLDAARVDYLPAGFGSHHWVARAGNGEQWFVTVDDFTSKDFLGLDPPAAFDALSKAFAVAAALRDGDLDWVVGPLRGADGRVLTRLGAQYSVGVFPYVEGTTSEDYSSASERRAVVALLTELHRAAKPLAGLARPETFRLPHRADLEAACAAVGERWSGGPYSEPARVLLRQHGSAVRHALVEYDELARTASRQRFQWVITHGEPHSANVLRTDQGLRVIDWDTAMLAPPERDLWMLVHPDGHDSLAEQYSDTTGHAVSPDLLRLYALWWDLSEIGVYLARFRAPHSDTEDDQESWLNLQHFVQSANAGERAGRSRVELQRATRR